MQSPAFLLPFRLKAYVLSVDLVRDAYLVNEVKSMAELVWREHHQNALYLIERWLPYRDEYSNA